MKKRCLKCGKKDAESYGLINLEFKGSSIRVLKEEEAHCEECFQKRFEKLLKKYGHLLKVADGKIFSIDWEAFCKEAEDGREMQMVEMLLGLDVVSLKCVGNLEIMSDHGMVLNPKFVMTCVYFQNHDDAARYAMAKYSDTEYNWHLRKILYSYSKAEIEQGYRKKKERSLP